MNQIDIMLAKAQIQLAFVFVIGIFALIFTLIFFHAQLSATALTIITSVITALVTVLTLQQNFFFARQRPPSLPDPSTTTVDSTTTIKTKSQPVGVPVENANPVSSPPAIAS